MMYSRMRFCLAVGWLVVSLPMGFGADATHNYQKWEKEIAAFEAADHTNQPPPNALLFVGSSTVRLWKTLARDFPDQSVINRGFGGSEIADATYFADRVIFPYRPRMVLLRAGGNDLKAGKTPQEVFADFKGFVAAVQTRLPQTEIVFISLSPSVARWAQADREKVLNTMVEEYAKQTPLVKYIDTYSISLDPNGQPRPELFVDDQLHFNAEGYRLLTDRVRSFLRR